HGNAVALTAAAERSYQIRQEARGKCLGAGVEFNARVRSHAVYYSFCLRKSKTVWVLQARGEPAADRVPSSVLGQTAAAARFSFAPRATIFPRLRSLEILSETASTPRSADRARLRLASPKSGNISNVGRRLSAISLPSCSNWEYRDGHPIHKRPQLAGTYRIIGGHNL